MKVHPWWWWWWWYKYVGGAKPWDKMGGKSTDSLLKAPFKVIQSNISMQLDKNSKLSTFTCLSAQSTNERETNGTHPVFWWKWLSEMRNVDFWRRNVLTPFYLPAYTIPESALQVYGSLAISLGPVVVCEVVQCRTEGNSTVLVWGGAVETCSESLLAIERPKRIVCFHLRHDPRVMEQCVWVR